MPIKISKYGSIIYELDVNEDSNESILSVKKAGFRFVFLKCEEEFLRNKKQVKDLINNLNIAGIRVYITISGEHYYAYLKNNNIIWVICPIEKVKSYRKKQYRYYILHKYIMHMHEKELHFFSLTNKDEERIKKVMTIMPEKVREVLSKKQVKITITSNALNRTLLAFSGSEWLKYNIFIIPG